MTYAEAVEHLHRLGPELPPSSDPAIPRRKFDLAHLRRLCQALGDPQDRIPSVLIAGTNGKGSTAATLAAICAAAGIRTGLYTSPHLSRVTERIQITSLGQIPDQRFADLYAQVDRTAETLVSSGELPHSPSFFERLTAIAFLYFAAERLDLAILEVGLGGRLDATNIVHPLLSIITDIALDHQDYLGATITAITGEKCGILRPGGTLITLPQLPEANQAIGVAATALDVRAINAAPYIPAPQRPAILRNDYTVSLPDGTLLHVDSPLSGQHQQRNISLAIAAALDLRSRFPISTEAIEAGIRATAWPARLEFITPGLLLDVAHNPAGAWTLRSALATIPETRPRTLIFSCLRDKDLAELSRILFPLFDSSNDRLRRHDHIILTPIPNPRATSAEDLLAAAHALGVPAHIAASPAAALAEARQVTPPSGLIVATGSVYLVGELRALALEHTA